MFEQFGWMHIVALLRGAGLTLGICVASTILGCILGVFLGMGELDVYKRQVISSADMSVLRKSSRDWEL